jgi:hypothetical protein
MTQHENSANLNLKQLISKIGRVSNFGKITSSSQVNNNLSASNYIVITYNQIFRNTFAFLVSIILLLTYILVPFSFASGGSAPNSFTKVGSSWVEVAEASKIYLESFGDQADDETIAYLTSGACTKNGITVNAPALVVDNGSCTVSKIPLPFNINFFGTTFSDTYLTSNGVMSFESSSGYNQSAFLLAASRATSLFAPLAADLYYDPTDSNIWVSPTTIDGKSAFVMSWEDMHACCNPDDSSPKASFQLVLLENGVGTGNFEAWFNFDKFEIVGAGYSAPETYIDLNSGLTVGSNEFIVKQTTGITTSCTEYRHGEFNLGTGNYPGGLFPSGNIFVKLLDAKTKKIEIFTDSICTIEWVPTTVGNLGTYLVIVANNYSIKAVPVGWAGYRASDNTVSATEFFANISGDTLVDSGTDPLIAKSLNTTVVGRFVLSMTGGETYGDPDGGPGAEDSGGGGAIFTPWVGEVSTICSEIDPGGKEVLETASNVVPRKVDAKNIVGNYITQENLDTLGKSNVFFDASSSKVKTATAVLPDLGCRDHLVKVKINQPIQFIVGGFKLQSNAQGYIQTSDGAWHNLSSTTLVEDTAAFLHTIQFLTQGKYLVVITQQPAFSEGMPLPVLGINSARFEVEVSKKKGI